MNTTATKTAYHVSLGQNGHVLHVLTFPTLLEATAYMADAQQAGFETAWSAMSGNVVIDLPVAAPVEEPKAKRAPKAKAAPAKTPKAKVGDPETARYELIVSVKETGKFITRKIVTGRAKADKYAETCRTNKVAKTVQITRLDG